MNGGPYEEIKRIRGENTEFGNIELSYQFAMKMLENTENLHTKKMIDIGTNMGTLPFLMFNRNKYNMVGVECREDAIIKGKEKYPEIADKLSVVGNRLADIENESFDVVTMFDVIEHIPNVDVYLREEVFRILRPGGVFIFQTPNARINPFFEMMRTKSFTAYKEYHCSLQTPKSLVNMLSACGFEDILIEKHTIDSEFNRKKLRKYFGLFAGCIIKGFSCAPLGIYPNLWGRAIKPIN